MQRKSHQSTRSLREYDFLNACRTRPTSVREHPVDAVLLDLDLPDMNGWEVLAELQTIKEIAEIPVIIISAMDFPQILYTNGRQVFEVMMRRPFSKQEMAAVLNAILDSVKPVYPRITNPNHQEQ